MRSAELRSVAVGELLPTKIQRLKNLSTGLSVIWRVARDVERNIESTPTQSHNSVKKQSPFSIPISRAREAREPHGGNRGPFAVAQESCVDANEEARRIANELLELHNAAAIKSEQDASFYANLVHRFDGSFTACFAAPPYSSPIPPHQRGEKRLPNYSARR